MASAARPIMSPRALPNTAWSPRATGHLFQAVTLESRTILREGTGAALTSADGARQILRVPQDLFFRVRGGPPPEQVEAPLVFIGYGVHLPEAGHDDFAGVDLAGKIAVVIGRRPARPVRRARLACPARSAPGCSPSAARPA